MLRRAFVAALHHAPKTVHGGTVRAPPNTIVHEQAYDDRADDRRVRFARRLPARHG